MKLDAVNVGWGLLTIHKISLPYLDASSTIESFLNSFPVLITVQYTIKFSLLPAWFAV